MRAFHPRRNHAIVDAASRRGLGGLLTHAAFHNVKSSNTNGSLARSCRLARPIVAGLP